MRRIRASKGLASNTLQNVQDAFARNMPMLQLIQLIQSISDISRRVIAHDEEFELTRERPFRY